MNTRKNRVKQVLVKMVMGLVLGGGAIAAVSGCDDDWGSSSGSGFRMGNFNQGLSRHVDCRRNPLDPRC